MQVKADPKVLLHMAEAVRSGKLSIPRGTADISSGSGHLASVSH